MSALDELKKRQINEDDLSPLEFVILRDSGEWSGAPEISDEAAKNLAEINDALDNAAKLLKRSEWVRFDRAVYKNYCWCCEHLMGEHYPECELNIWLSKHRAGDECPPNTD